MHPPLRRILQERAIVSERRARPHILEAFWRDGTLGYGIIAAVKPA
jgi:hypothetical protein